MRRERDGVKSDENFESRFMEQTEHFYERQDRIKENGNFFRFTVSVSLLDLCLPILPLKRFQSEKNFGSDYFRVCPVV